MGELEAKTPILHVLYDYDGQDPDELTLRRGSRIEVLSKSNTVSGSDGWWAGRIAGSTTVGVFPADFVAESQPDFRIIDSKDLKIGEVIGIGGFGQVHHAKYGDVDVAIKVARSLGSLQLTPAGSIASNVGPVQSSDNVAKPAIDQLLREARLFANLDHKNIIQLYGVCVYPRDGYISLVLEYAHGGPLSKLLERRSRGVFPRVFINYAAQIVAGMYYLHQVSKHGIIHRDLKSSNVLILESIENIFDDAALLRKTLKITDFGLAKQEFQSSTSSTVGTYPWMSPEYVKSGKYSQKSDVWSFGVLLWELLTGEIPYRGFDQMQLAYGIGTGEYHLPIPKHCPPEFTNLIQDCWQKDPQDRPDFKDLTQRIRNISELEYYDDSFQSTAAEMQQYSSMQNAWRDEIRVSFAELKRVEQEVENRRLLLEQRAIEQNNEQERLNQWAKQLEKKQQEINENEIRFALSVENQRLNVGIHPPKIRKRTGIFRRIALFALNHSNTLITSNVAKMAISQPTMTAQDTIPIRLDTKENNFKDSRGAFQQSYRMIKNSTTSAHSKASCSNQIRTTSSEQSLAPKLDATSKVSRKNQQPTQRPDLNVAKNGAKSCSTLAGDVKETSSRSRFPYLGKSSRDPRKSKPKATQWYYETTTSPDIPTTPSTTRSTPTLDRIVTRSGFASSSSICLTPKDRSLTCGLLNIAQALENISNPQFSGFQIGNSTESVGEEILQSPQVSMDNVNTNHAVSNDNDDSVSFEIHQHQRTVSSPEQHSITSDENATIRIHRPRPLSTRIQMNSISFPAIPPPPSPSHSAHTRHSDSKLNGQFRFPQGRINNGVQQRSCDDQTKRVNSAPADGTRWSSEEETMFSSLLDLETDEQKQHRTKVLPPKIERQDAITSEALERIFLRENISHR